MLLCSFQKIQVVVSLDLSYLYWKEWGNSQFVPSVLNLCLRAFYFLCCYLHNESLPTFCVSIFCQHFTSLCLNSYHVRISLQVSSISCSWYQQNLPIFLLFNVWRLPPPPPPPFILMLKDDLVLPDNHKAPDPVILGHTAKIIQFIFFIIVDDAQFPTNTNKSTKIIIQRTI